MRSYSEVIRSTRIQEKLEDANQRLANSVGALGRVVDETSSLADLPEHILRAVEFYTGRAIKELVQEHLGTHLVRLTSVRGRDLDMGIRGEVVLNVDDGQLYDVPKSQRKIAPAEPLPDQQWARNWENILSQVTCLKYY